MITQPRSKIVEEKHIHLARKAGLLCCSLRLSEWTLMRHRLLLVAVHLLSFLHASLRSAELPAAYTGVILSSWPDQVEGTKKSVDRLRSRFPPASSGRRTQLAICECAIMVAPWGPLHSAELPRRPSSKRNRSVDPSQLEKCCPALR